MAKKKKKRNSLDKTFNPAKQSEMAKAMIQNGAKYIQDTPFGESLKKRLGVEKYHSLWHRPANDPEEFTESGVLYQFRILDMYMQKIPNYEVRDKDINIEHFAINSDRMINLIKRIMRRCKDKEKFSFRVHSPNFSLWVSMEIDGEVMSEITYVLVDEVHKIARTEAFIFYIKDRMIIDSTDGCFVFASRKEEAQMILDQMEDTHMRLSKNTNDLSRIQYAYGMDYFAIMLLDEILYKFSEDAANKEYKELWLPDYTDTEIELFRSLAADSLEFPLIKVSNVLSWINPEQDQGMYDKLKNESEMPDILVAPAGEEIPLLDLTEKEMNYITKYCEDKGIKPTLKNPFGREIDLMKYLRMPRWGATLRYEVPNEVGTKEYMCTTSYTLYPDKDYLRFYIVYHKNRDLVLYLMVDFNKLEEFRFDTDHIVTISCDIMQKNPYKLFKSWEDMKREIPGFMTTLNQILELVMRLLYTHIVIFDRPQRMRMVQYVPRAPRQPPTVTPEEPEFVVRRILKPLAEVKRLIKEEKDYTGPERHYEFTATEWNRIGHWRRKPHSEELIWIEPTMCHRRAELTDKEIHLKL